VSNLVYLHDYTFTYVVYLTLIMILIMSLGLLVAQYRQPTEIQRQTIGFALRGNWLCFAR